MYLANGENEDVAPAEADGDHVDGERGKGIPEPVHAEHQDRDNRRENPIQDPLVKMFR